MQGIKTAETNYPIEAGQISGRHGDVLATAWSKHSPMLYRIAFRKLRNAEDAEDAVQDALLSAYKKMDQFRGAAQLSTWLGSIVLNAARMRLRHRLTRNAVSLDANGEQGEPVWYDQLVASGPDPEELAKRAEIRDILERVADELPPRIRTAFRLRVFDGLSTDEAAAALGVPVGTLKARVFRALRRATILMRQSVNSRGTLKHKLNRMRQSRRRVHEVCSKPVAEATQLQGLCL